MKRFVFMKGTLRCTSLEESNSDHLDEPQEKVGETFCSNDRPLLQRNNAIVKQS
jgi:hypothetical protein